MSSLTRVLRCGMPLQHIRRSIESLPGLLNTGHLPGGTHTFNTKPSGWDLHQLRLSHTLEANLRLNSATLSVTNLTRPYSSQSGNDSQGMLVYKGRVSHLFKMLKLFSLTTSGIGLGFQPYLWITYQDMPLGAAVPFFAAINVFVFVNPILIHYVAKKYVTELHFNPLTKVFSAVVLTFFARREVITFKAEDVQVPDVPNMFAMLTVKGRPLFVHESDFTSLEVYKHLMGFDRPLDLTYIHKDEKTDQPQSNDRVQKS